jgi:hypothetical protein
MQSIFGSVEEQRTCTCIGRKRTQLEYMMKIKDSLAVECGESCVFDEGIFQFVKRDKEVELKICVGDGRANANQQHQQKHLVAHFPCMKIRGGRGTAHEECATTGNVANQDIAQLCKDCVNLGKSGGAEVAGLPNVGERWHIF